VTAITGSSMETAVAELQANFSFKPIFWNISAATVACGNSGPGASAALYHGNLKSRTADAAWL
jgi:hypothetical protein